MKLVQSVLRGLPVLLGQPVLKAQPVLLVRLDHKVQRGKPVL